MKISKRYAEAFKENFNVVGLTTVLAVSAATLQPLPLLVGLVAEAAYLLFMPDFKWYDARLSRQRALEVKNRRKRVREEIVPTLRREMQETFTRLEDMRAQLGDRALEREPWFCAVLDKLDYLLEKFLLFASKESQFREYLHSVRLEMRGDMQSENNIRPEPEKQTQGNRRQRPARTSSSIEANSKQSPPSSGGGGIRTDARSLSGTILEIQHYYDREIEGLQKEQDQEKDTDTQAILQKRLEVIKRRKEFVGKMDKILGNLNHQLRLVEDTFGLISDEVRAHSPEQLLSDIEEVVGQTDDMTKVLEEVASYEQVVARIPSTMA